MSKTGFVFHEDYLKHKTAYGHPERPERLENLIKHLQTTEVYSKLIQIPPKPAPIHWIEKIHPKGYIENIENACKSGLQYLDSDTYVCQNSFASALLAAGGVLEACKRVLEKQLDNAFCAVRPPGHHAEPTRAMGFCLFNNVAIAARYVQKYGQLEKVAIVDWDVHHGNGTQNAFYEDPSVFYISIHQHPLYPGTGKKEEHGAGAGEGFNLNFPSPAGFGDQEYLDIFKTEIVPTLINFEPDFLLISAGFDAHKNDPLANMQVTETGFLQMTELLIQISMECCQGRVVSVLEGGYDLQGLAHSVEYHLKALLN